jgi:hypothetical protein
MIASASVAGFDGLFRSSERSIHIAGIRSPGFDGLNSGTAGAALRFFSPAGTICFWHTRKARAFVSDFNAKTSQTPARVLARCESQWIAHFLTISVVAKRWLS